MPGDLQAVVRRIGKSGEQGPGLLNVGQAGAQRGPDGAFVIEQCRHEHTERHLRKIEADAQLGGSV